MTWKTIRESLLTGATAVLGLANLSGAADWCIAWLWNVCDSCWTSRSRLYISTLQFDPREVCNMAPAVPLTTTPNTRWGRLPRHLVNGSRRPIQPPTVESYNLRRFVEVVPLTEPTVFPSVESEVIPHWIFTPEPARSEGNGSLAETHSDHVPAVVAIILAMVAMGCLLSLAVAGQLLKWSRRAKSAGIKELGRRWASTNTPQTGDGPAVGKHIQRRSNW